jgi:hypothetical protein
MTTLGRGSYLGAGDAQADDEPEPYTFTREQLIDALRKPQVTGTLRMLEELGGGPEDLADAIIEALGDPVPHLTKEG